MVGIIGLILLIFRFSMMEIPWFFGHCGEHENHFYLFLLPLCDSDFRLGSDILSQI